MIERSIALRGPLDLGDGETSSGAGVSVDGSAAENMRTATRLTQQTGQVQTPSSGRSDREVAFLSDSGGHGNVWVAQPDTGSVEESSA